MNKEIKIEYQPNIDNLMKVSKYLLLNIRFVKYFPIVFIVLFCKYLTTFINKLKCYSGRKKLFK